MLNKIIPSKIQISTKEKIEMLKKQTEVLRKKLLELSKKR